MLPRGWQFRAALRQEHVSDAFDILSLLEDHAKRKTTLRVPNSGPQDERFDAAKHARNERIRMLGQDEVDHLCKKCVREITLKDGSKSFIFHSVQKHDLNHSAVASIHAVVSDGNRMGRRTCRVHNCKEKLPKGKRRFCESHKSLVDQCAVVGCDAAIASPGRLTCVDARHTAIETAHRKRGNAAFQLKHKMQQAQVAHPTDSMEDGTHHSIDEGMVQANDELGDHEAVELTLPDSSTLTKLKAHLTYNRTANEQLMVAPCGMIIGRETFYGAEAHGTVWVTI